MSSFSEFFSGVDPALTGIFFVSVAMIFLSPSSPHFKIGTLLIFLPIFYAEYFEYSEATGRIIHEIIRPYHFPKVGNILPYHQNYLEKIFRILSDERIIIPMSMTLAVGMFPVVLMENLYKRYYSSLNHLLLFLSIALKILSVYVTYGLSLLPLFLIYAATKKGAENHRTVITGKEAIKDMYRGIFLINMKLLFRRKNGIKIHEFIRIPISFENRGIIIFGAPGSGKSHLIKNHFIPQIMKRKDQAVIYDYKGEFTAAFGEDDDVLIVSPLDERSGIWDIARDVDTEAKAWEFGSMVVQRGDSSHDTIFEEWTRDLLTAAIIRLQVEKKGAWSFRDFYQNCQDLEWLIGAVRIYRKESEFSANFTDASRQFEAIKGTIRRAMVRLEPLARAWGDSGEKERLFSLTDWVKNKGALKKRVLIIRDDPLYQETMGPFVSNFLNFLFSLILSQNDAAGNHKNRRIWAVLDEFQLLPKIPRLFEAARAGRSKGLRLLLGTQDLGRIDEMYKKEGSRDTLINLIGFKIAGHLGSQGMQEFASGLLSKNEIEVRQKNMSYLEGKKSTNHSLSLKVENAIAPGEFGAISLPSDLRGSIFWLIHQGWNPVRLRYQCENLKNKYEIKRDEKWLSDMDRYWTSENQDEDGKTGDGDFLSEDQIATKKFEDDSSDFLRVEEKNPVNESFSRKKIEIDDSHFYDNL